MLEELQLGVGVRADFAVQVDLFVLRGCPFHFGSPRVTALIGPEKCSTEGLGKELDATKIITAGWPSTTHFQAVRDEDA